MASRKWLVIGFASLLLTVAPSWGQGDPDRPTGGGSGVGSVPFQFAPPGARALGMAGAFIAVADDATAAEANPAGLVILSRPEVSVHGRYTSYDIEAVDLFAADIENFYDAFVQNGSNADFFRATRGPGSNTIANFDESESEVSFASYVHPFSSWTFSVFYQQAASFRGNDDDFDLTLGFTDPFGGNPIFRYTSAKALDVDLVHYGIGAAFRLGSKVSLGVSVRQTELDLVNVDQFTEFDEFFEPGASFRQTNARTSSDEDVTFTAGLLFNPNGTWSGGIVFKEGGKFETQLTNTRVNTCCGGFSATDTAPGSIEVPDFLGAGIAWRPSDQFLVALDVNQIEYSVLDAPIESFFAPQTAELFEEIDDAIEVRLGLEYTILAGGRTPWSFRLGAWSEEDHDGLRTIDTDQTHVTAGVGVVAGPLQVDFAVDIADTADVGVLSMVYRF